jgi:hypothetical protein
LPQLPLRSGSRPAYIDGRALFCLSCLKEEERSGASKYFSKFV